MDTKNDRIAALANASAYDSGISQKYIDGAPHIKHASLRTLYARMLVDVFDFAKRHTAVPRVLDLGAGEGTVTLSFLELGAKVTAVDISSSQLNELRAKCERFGDRLEVRCEDINDFLVSECLNPKHDHYDIIAAISFLHHIPDYVAMINNAIALLSPHGQFFSFQDPLRYDSLPIATRMFSSFSYFSWRIFKGDVIGGAKRYLRRKRGIYLENSIHDNAEYHVVRNGVDQDAICNLFRKHDFECRLVLYFSTHSHLLQPVGALLGMKNTFAVIAQRKTSAEVG